MSDKAFSLFTLATAGKVDRETGLISGVSVITMGEAKGHDMYVDATTIKQVKEAAETYKKGLKVKMDHYSGISEIVGYLRNFRIEGEKLLADLQLLRTHPKREYILELAEEISDNFGLSISFSGQHEKVQGIWYARCQEIYSADLVTEPAANENGLFEKNTSVDTQKKPEATNTFHMDKTELAEIVKQAIEPISREITDLKAKVNPTPAEKTEDQKKAEFDDKVAKAVTAELAKLNIKPVAANTEVKATEKEKPKKFSDLVKEQIAAGKSKADAIRFCARNYHELHLAEAQVGIKL